MCIWGVIITSLFVVTISDKLELTQLQKNAYVLIQRLVFRDELKRVSASAIFSMFRFSKAFRNDRDVNVRTTPKMLKSAEENFKRKMLQFRDKNSEMRKFDNTTEYTFLSLNLINLWEEIQEFKEKQDKLSEHQNEVISMLTFLCKKKR